MTYFLLFNFLFSEIFKNYVFFYFEIFWKTIHKCIDFTAKILRFISKYFTLSKDGNTKNITNLDIYFPKKIKVLTFIFLIFFFKS